MKTLACKDLGNPQCPFVAEGETAEEAVQKMKDHAKSTHMNKLAGMSEEEMDKMMSDQVKEM